MYIEKIHLYQSYDKFVTIHTLKGQVEIQINIHLL
jgi:hypothetical protein